MGDLPKQGAKVLSVHKIDFPAVQEEGITPVRPFSYCLRSVAVNKIFRGIGLLEAEQGRIQTFFVLRKRADLQFSDSIRRKADHKNRGRSFGALFSENSRRK